MPCDAMHVAAFPVLRSFGGRLPCSLVATYLDHIPNERPVSAYADNFALPLIADTHTVILRLQAFDRPNPRHSTFTIQLVIRP